MNSLFIQIVYGDADKQTIISLQLPENSTVADALDEIKLKIEDQKLGIFGHVVMKETVLKNHDRIEIYRPLEIDPKQARLLRAKRNKKTSSC